MLQKTKVDDWLTDWLIDWLNTWWFMELWVRSPEKVLKSSVEKYFNIIKDHHFKKINPQTLSGHDSGYSEEGHLVLLAEMRLLTTHKLLQSSLAFPPLWLPASHLGPAAGNQVARKPCWRSSEPNGSQGRAAVNTSPAFSWPNWTEAHWSL